MMTSKSKGTDFEKRAVDILNKNVKRGEFKRVPTSGAIGTIANEPLLMGDIKGKIYGISRPILFEAKCGYGNDKQLTVKKEWLDKVAKEAEASLSIPFLVARFTNSRSGVGEFVAMDIKVFAYLMNLITDLQENLDEITIRNIG